MCLKNCWMSGKQKSAAVSICVWSVSTLFVTYPAVLHIYLPIVNPKKPNGLSLTYIFSVSICHARDVRCICFKFLFYLNWNSRKQAVKTLIPRRLMRHLIKVCTVFLCPTKATTESNNIGENTQEMPHKSNDEQNESWNESIALVF